MGQSAFADALVQTLLGWLRWLADIAWSLLQGGSGFLRWFSSHWVALLVGLIIACLFVDWLIWMLRWRPYWLWFRKKRPVLLDDDAMARRAVEFAQPKPQPPRFHSSALRNEREDEEAFYEEMEDMSESASMFDEEDFTPPRARASCFSGRAGQGGLGFFRHHTHLTMKNMKIMMRMRRIPTHTTRQKARMTAKRWILQRTANICGRKTRRRRRQKKK